MSTSNGNELAVKGPGGIEAVAKGFNSITALVLAAALAFTVYNVKEGFADIKREHQRVERQLAIGNCIQTLTPGERQALNFNKGASWRRWCWWMPEDDMVMSR